MSTKLIKFILFSILSLFVFPVFCSATVTDYVRSPSGASVESPVTFSGTLSDPPEGALYWVVIATTELIGGNYWGTSHSVVDTTFSQSFDLAAPDNVQFAGVMWCAVDDFGNTGSCNDDNLGIDDFGDMFSVVAGGAAPSGFSEFQSDNIGTWIGSSITFFSEYVLFAVKSLYEHSAPALLILFLIIVVFYWVYRHFFGNWFVRHGVKKPEIELHFTPEGHIKSGNLASNSDFDRRRYADTLYWTTGGKEGKRDDSTNL